MRTRADARRVEIQRLWSEGASLKTIGVALDSTSNSVGVEIARMRADGWDLPHRYRLRSKAVA